MLGGDLEPLANQLGMARLQMGASSPIGGAGDGPRAAVVGGGCLFEFGGGAGHVALAPGLEAGLPVRALVAPGGVRAADLMEGRPVGLLRRCSIRRLALPRQGMVARRLGMVGLLERTSVRLGTSW